MKKSFAKKWRGRLQSLLLSIFLFLLFNGAYLGSAQAIPGSLDINFGLQGLVVTDFGADGFDEASAVAIQSDGKIVAAGDSDAANGDLDFAVARYNTDGTLDTTFNPSGPIPGLATVDATGAGNEDQARAIAIQSDGKIVIAGFAFVSGNFDFALARFNTNGTLDTTFNPLGTTPGLVTTDIVGKDDRAFAVAIQSDEQIVVAGSSFDGTSTNFALARYNTTDGSLDTTFNPGGTLPPNVAGLVTTDFSGSGSGDDANAVAIQSNGNIVAAGSSSSGGSLDFALARYDTAGNLDTTLNPLSNFGPAPGLVTTNFSGSSVDIANAVSIQSDGKIVAAGVSDASGDNDFALARYDGTDGALDTTFNPGGTLAPGVAGLVTTDFSGSSSDTANALVIQSNGKLVAAGVSDASGSLDFAMARYDTTGSLDTAFNFSGKVTTDFSGSSSDTAHALAIQSNGKLVAAGISDSSGSKDFALARYLGDAADLSILKTASTSAAAMGDTVTYTITVKNNGPQDAGGVVVTDVLTGAVSFGSISASQGNCTGTNDLSCDLGTLANGGSATLTIPVTTTAAGGISNTAKVAGQVVDPDTTNNLASAFVNVSGGSGPASTSADLSIAKTASPASPAVGDTVTYTITVTNHGPDPASGIVVTDAIFGVFSDLSASSTQGTCTVSGPVTCNLGDLVSGASATLTVTLTAGDFSPLSDLATVISQAIDPDLSNNNATVNLSVGSGRVSGGGGCSLNRDGSMGHSSTVLLFLLTFAGLWRWRKTSRGRPTQI